MFSNAENYKWNKYPRIPIQQTVLIFKKKIAFENITRILCSEYGRFYTSFFNETNHTYIKYTNIYVKLVFFIPIC